MDYYIAPNLWGTPTDGGGFSYDVFQGEQPACAVYSQYNVLKDYGYTGTAEDLIAEATDKGWYDPENGTSFQNVGKLLESHGVPCDVFINANRYNLLGELAQGKKVIVTVDSGELWCDGKLSKLGEMLEDILPGGADHALVVTGFDTSDPNNVMITLTDSGSGQAAVSYPIGQFEDAWHDGHCTMVVPREPPPLEMNLPSMANLDRVEDYLWSNVSSECDGHGLEDFVPLQVDANGDWESCAIRYYENDAVNMGQVNHPDMQHSESLVDDAGLMSADDGSIGDGNGGELW